MKKRVLVVLSTPLTCLDGHVYLSDRVHAQTLEILAERFEDVVVVARCRTKALLAASEQIELVKTGARLGLGLLDYGGSIMRVPAFLLAPGPRRELSMLIRGAELLYVESPSLESVLVWSLNRGPHMKPYVIEMRGESVLNAPYMHSRFGPFGPVISRLLTEFYRVFRRDAAGAVFVGEEIRRRYAPPNTPTVAVSSVKLPPCTPRPPRHFLGPARRFLYIGHLEKVKAIHVILDSFGAVASDLPGDWQLDLVGDGPERHVLQRRAESLGIAPHVRFHGRVPWGDELFRFYEEADLLLLGSLTEGNSRTLLEGMAFGVPALSTAVGEAPRLLPGEALVPPADIPAFTAALRRIATSPEGLTALSLHNVEQAAQFTPAELRRRREEFFDRFLDVLGTAESGPLSLESR